MISLKQIYNKTHEYIFRRKLSSETQQEVSPPPAKSVYNSILSGPFESYFRTLLRLLIWEQPYLSAVAFVTLNIFYWLIVAWNRRFFSILSIFGIFIFLHRTWICYWSKIKVPPLGKEDTESWTELHCHSSNSEIYCTIRDMVEKAAVLMRDVWKLRKENRGLFCSLMCGFFSFLAFVGKVFPGVLLIYGLVLFMTLGPGIMLHLVPETIFEQFKGFFSESDGQASPATTGDRDSDLEEFVPELSPETFRQLSLKDENLDFQSLGSLEPESLPAMGEDSYANESEDFSLYQGLGSFPSVEEENESDLDDSDKIILSEQTTTENKTTEMHFNPKHFKEDSNSSSGSEDHFTEGLSFGKKEILTTDAKKEEVTTWKSSRRSSLSDEDELADFEILEESDIPT